MDNPPPPGEIEGIYSALQVDDNNCPVALFSELQNRLCDFQHRVESFERFRRRARGPFQQQRGFSTHLDGIIRAGCRKVETRQHLSNVLNNTSEQYSRKFDRILSYATALENPVFVSNIESREIDPSVRNRFFNDYDRWMQNVEAQLGPEYLDDFQNFNDSELSFGSSPIEGHGRSHRHIFDQCDVRYNGEEGWYQQRRGSFRGREMSFDDDIMSNSRIRTRAGSQHQFPPQARGEWGIGSWDGRILADSQMRMPQAYPTWDRGRDYGIRIHDQVGMPHDGYDLSNSAQILFR